MSSLNHLLNRAIVGDRAYDAALMQSIANDNMLIADALLQAQEREEARLTDEEAHRKRKTRLFEIGEFINYLKRLPNNERRYFIARTLREKLMAGLTVETMWDIQDKKAVREAEKALARFEAVAPPECIENYELLPKIRKKAEECQKLLVLWKVKASPKKTVRLTVVIALQLVIFSMCVLGFCIYSVRNHTLFIASISDWDQSWWLWKTISNPFFVVLSGFIAFGFFGLYEQSEPYYSVENLPQWARQILGVDCEIKVSEVEPIFHKISDETRELVKTPEEAEKQLSDIEVVLAKYHENVGDLVGATVYYRP